MDVVLDSFATGLPVLMLHLLVTLAMLVGGVVIVEGVFVYPGLGYLMVDSVLFRDMPMVRGTAMVFASTYVLLNLLADILSIIANPRLRHRK